MIIRLTVLILFLFSSVSFAVTVDRVDISGNRRIPDSRIRPYLINAGAEFSPERINTSILQLHETGHFTEIVVYADVQGNDFVITYIVQETPLIASVEFNGNKQLSNDRLTEALALRVGGPLNLTQLGNSIRNIQEEYEKDQYFSVNIDYRIQNRNETSVNLIFDIEEGERSRVYNIWFFGNTTFTDSELREAMQTKQKDFWSKLNKSGTVVRDRVELDRELLRQFYMSKGFAQVEIGEAELGFQENPARMNYLVRIKEGPRFTVSNVGFADREGRYTTEQLETMTRLKAGDYFDVTAYQADIRRLTDAYAELGYAQANVDGRVNFEPMGNAVNITYSVTEGNLFTINRIIFEGNEITRDNVLRREFDIVEGETYNSRLLRAAQGNLYTTGFFDNVSIVERPVGPDQMDVVVNVSERKLGSLNLVISYSSAEQWVGRVEVARANLFGFGSTARFAAEQSRERQDFILSFEEPWIMDRPYSAGFEVYSRTRDYDNDYRRHALGGQVSVGHQPIKRRLFLRYALSHDQVTISHINTNSSQYIKDQEGTLVVNAFTPSITFSRLNNNLDPSQGIRTSSSLKLAGMALGGDADFAKLIMRNTYYQTLPSGFVGVVNTEGGMIWPLGDTKIPIDERFTLGGMYSVRGFRSRSISPVDGEGYTYGGNKYYQANFEVWRPLFEGNLTIRGVMFLDMGQVYDENELLFSVPPRRSVGAGIRFFTPMGLIRLEYGYKLDKKPGEDQATWEFSIGSLF